MSVRNEKRPIVVVEDDPDDQLMLRRAFAGAGLPIPIRFFNNGREALEFFFTQDRIERLPCLIFLDLGLPEVPGQALLERLRAEAATRHIPVVIYSCNQNPSVIAATYGEGASSFISKTSSPGKLQEDLKTVMDYWLKICQLPC